ncbi:flavodoxin I [Paenibacillus shirakamiensis]|uniref:Flavodoxin n=1 Tax=Paenibacillus shirakamiensis TaxID=1265935 RepID=A0ABS4JH13_9BACL|nr:flavodoxin [Paenibacillus shirakamiensis]MBP2000335.1 flavodoxin I [Paenibacillus shirakamiensis]
MRKAIVVYTSMSGNTLEMAESIVEGLQQGRIEVVLKDVLDTSAQELVLYDCIVLGSYTWGEGDLPDEYLPFYRDMKNLNLQGIRGAVFGSGDLAYNLFAAAVDQLRDRLVYCGVEMAMFSLKIDRTPSEFQLQECERFGLSLAAKLNKAGLVC